MGQHMIEAYRNCSGTHTAVPVTAADGITLCTTTTAEPTAGGAAVASLYQAVPHALAFRCAVTPGVRHSIPRGLGFLEAPHGAAAIAYLSLVGTATLMAWNADVTKRALAIFHATAQSNLLKALAGSASGHLPHDDSLHRGGVMSHGSGGAAVGGSGYLLDASDALGCLAAFPEPDSALLWALDCVQGLLQADW